MVLTESQKSPRGGRRFIHLFPGCIAHAPSTRLGALTAVWHIRSGGLDRCHHVGDWVVSVAVETEDPKKTKSRGSKSPAAR
jgi:hypothetical protein